MAHTDKVDLWVDDNEPMSYAHFLSTLFELVAEPVDPDCPAESEWRYRANGDIRNNGKGRCVRCPCGRAVLRPAGTQWRSPCM